MNSISKIVRNFINDESGQDLIEYALVAALVALGSVAALGTLSGKINGVFASITAAL